MAINKDKYVVTAAKLFIELLSKARIDWDEGFYRYVEYSKSHFSSQWSFQLEGKLKLVKIEEELKEEYLDTLEKLMEGLFSLIEEDGNDRPVVVVLKVSSLGNFNLSFENEDIKALDISKLSLGTENSFFKEGEVDL